MRLVACLWPHKLRSLFIGLRSWLGLILPGFIT
jgi:hypothetical protein